MQNQNTELVLLGTLAVLGFASAFDKTAPYAIGILLLMLALVWYSAYSSGSLTAFAQYLQQRFNPQSAGTSGSFWSF